MSNKKVVTEKNLRELVNTFKNDVFEVVQKMLGYDQVLETWKAPACLLNID
jgi:hypothetical protein